MSTRSSRPPIALAFTALLLLALNLRPAISTVPPLTQDIQQSVGWSDAAIGLVTTIPVLCMGVLAPVVPKIAARIGRTWTAAAAMALVTCGTVLRLIADAVPITLMVSALLAGAGIAIGAGLAPSFVRDWFPHSMGATTGSYTGALMLGAAVGSAVSVPLYHLAGSWPVALALWAVPAGAALALWIVVGLRHPTPVLARASRPVTALPWRNPIAWALAAYLGLNSIVFYSLLAWLAPSFSTRGWTQTEAGLLLGFSAVTQIVGALVLPRIAARLRDRRPLYISAILASAVGIAVVGFAPSLLTWEMLALNGIGLGGSFALGVVLLSEYAASPESSATLTALAFLIAYGMGALGPVVMGTLIGATGSWPLVFTVLAVLCLGQIAAVLPLRRGAVVR